MPDITPETNEALLRNLQIIEAGIAEFGIGNQTALAEISPAGRQGNFDPANPVAVASLVPESPAANPAPAYNAAPSPLNG